MGNDLRRIVDGAFGGVNCRLRCPVIAFSERGQGTVWSLGAHDATIILGKAVACASGGWLGNSGGNSRAGVRLSKARPTNDLSLIGGDGHDSGPGRVNRKHLAMSAYSGVIVQ